jgi:hypothetical protein
MTLPRRRVGAGIVDPNFTVRSGAVASERHPGLTYVDYRMPDKFWPFLAVHEQTERKAMQAGMPYARAHTQIATPAERDAVQQEGRAFGYSWERYTRAIDGELEHIETEHGERPPPPDPHVNIADAVGHHRDKP